MVSVPVLPLCWWRMVAPRLFLSHFASPWSEKCQTQPVLLLGRGTGNAVRAEHPGPAAGRGARVSASHSLCPAPAGSMARGSSCSSTSPQRAGPTWGSAASPPAGMANTWALVSPPYNQLGGSPPGAKTCRPQSSAPPSSLSWHACQDALLTSPIWEPALYQQLVVDNQVRNKPWGRNTCISLRFCRRPLEPDTRLPISRLNAALLDCWGI